MSLGVVKFRHVFSSLTLLSLDPGRIVLK